MESQRVARNLVLGFPGKGPGDLDIYPLLISQAGVPDSKSNAEDICTTCLAPFFSGESTGGKELWLCAKDLRLSQNFLVLSAGQGWQNTLHMPDCGTNLVQIANTSEGCLWLGQGVQTVRRRNTKIVSEVTVAVETIIEE